MFATRSAVFSRPVKGGVERIISDSFGVFTTVWAVAIKDF